MTSGTGRAMGGSFRSPALSEVRRLVAEGDVAVLSGAGLSTDSGIPDYRGPTGALRKHAPMTYHAFVHEPRSRHRYWARSYLGWPQLARARPNAGHRAVADLQSLGALSAIITQNVDGLHQSAGAVDVVELHGGLHRTVCVHCGAHRPRAEVDQLLQKANPYFNAHVEAINPDGDADVADDDLVDFVMIDCPDCGVGPLKPDVVFFGESVPRDRVDHCFGLVEASRTLLVLGSSLKVMSGYRFVVRAAKLGLAIVIVNQGPTRGDGLSTIRLDAPLGEVLPALVAR